MTKHETAVVKYIFICIKTLLKYLKPNTLIYIKGVCILLLFVISWLFLLCIYQETVFLDPEIMFESQLVIQLVYVLIAS